MANGHLESGEAHAFQFCYWLDNNGLSIKMAKPEGSLDPTKLFVDQGSVVSAMNLSKTLLRLRQESAGKLSKEDSDALMRVAGFLESL